MDFQVRCSLENLIFPEEYFEEEVREGFYVSGMMKRYWACQLLVLSEIDKICRKHDIKWYADCGSLMGAVRHRGYIPWDDDLDICMLRHDYIRFFEVAKDELPKGFKALSLGSDEEYLNMIGRVVNSAVIDFGKEHLERFCGCPYTVGVDIFPLDGIYEDEEKEEDRRLRTQEVAEAITLLEKDGHITSRVRDLLGSIEKKNHIILHRNDKLIRQLYDLAGKLYSECTSESAKNVVLMPFWLKNHDHKYDVSSFKERMELPFENTYLPVPWDYETVLEIEYGEFIEIHKEGGIHDYPVYRQQEEILRNKIMRNPFRYTFSKEDFEKASAKKTFSQQISDCTEMLKQAPANIQMLVNAGDADNAAALLTGCQNIAVSIGNLFEGKFNEPGAVVSLLEEYCEKVYSCSESWNETSAEELTEFAKKIDLEAKSFLENAPKEVLFLAVKGSWWNSLAPVYDHFQMDVGSKEKYEVHVVNIPWFRKKNGEPLEDLILETKDFPDGILTDSIEEYDVSARRPDITVIQFPYDSYDSALGIPPKFYSENLINYTDKLLYVPMLETDDPKDEEDKLFSALQPFIEQPAIVFADEVILYSQKLRDAYISIATNLAGDNTKDLWEKKVVFFEPEKDVSEGDAAKRKQVLYGISSGFLIRYQDKAIEKIERSLNVFEDSSAKVFALISISEEEELARLCPQLYEKLFSLIKTYEAKGICAMEPAAESLVNTDKINAYYGDRTYLARCCANAGIPVMIENIDILD